MIRRYIIQDSLESEDCPWCGFPLAVGDDAVELLSSRGEVLHAGFCSAPCSGAWLDESTNAVKAMRENKVMMGRWRPNGNRWFYFT